MNDLLTKLIKSHCFSLHSEVFQQADFYYSSFLEPGYSVFYNILYVLKTKKLSLQMLLLSCSLLIKLQCLSLCKDISKIQLNLLLHQLTVFQECFFLKNKKIFWEPWKKNSFRYFGFLVRRTLTQLEKMYTKSNKYLTALSCL